MEKAVTVCFTLTKEEKEKLTNLAKESHKTISAYIRDKVIYEQKK